MREKLHHFALMLSFRVHIVVDVFARISGKDRPHTPCTFVSTLPRLFMQDWPTMQLCTLITFTDRLWKNINLLC